MALMSPGRRLTDRKRSRSLRDSRAGNQVFQEPALGRSEPEYTSNRAEVDTGRRTCRRGEACRKATWRIADAQWNDVSRGGGHIPIYKRQANAAFALRGLNNLGERLS